MKKSSYFPTSRNRLTQLRSSLLSRLSLPGTFVGGLLALVLLTGAGNVPVQNFLPQGPMQGDLNAGTHNLTNATLITAAQFSGSGAGLTNVPPAALFATNAPASGQVFAYANAAQGYWTTPSTASFTQVNADWNATSGVAQILNKPTIPAPVTSLPYSSITGTPIIPAAQVNADWNASSGLAQILNKPTIPAPVTSLPYSSITGTPTIPAAQVNADWNATSGLAQILNKPTIPAPVTSLPYSSITGTPTIPAAQVNADWNATSGVAQILNKPTIPAPVTTLPYSSITGTPTLGSLAALSSINNANWNGTPLALANGGTGTTTPSLVAGSNVTISGTWPNQTINSTASGGGGTGLSPTTIVLITSGTSWTLPTGKTAFRIRMVGGGGGGGYPGSSTSGGGGGGAGAYCETIFTGQTPGTSYTLAIGSGGLGQTWNSTSSVIVAGTSGTPTSITVAGTTYTAAGGTGFTQSGATTVIANTSGGNGGTAGTNGIINLAGAYGQNGGGASYTSTLEGGNGASTPFGQGGRGGVNASGVNALGYGAGGGGAGALSTNAGNGSPGCIVIEY